MEAAQAADKANMEMSCDYKAWLRPALERVEAYVPGEQPRDVEQYVKLNTNENPYPPSPVVEHAVRHFRMETLRVYPDPVCTKVRQEASRIYKVPVSQIFVGNGSDEVLSLLMRIAISPGDRVVYPYPTYVLYRTLAQIADAEPVEIDLKDDFSLPADFAAQAGQLTIFARPNSPTSNVFDSTIVEETLLRRRGLVVLDEAYAAFSGVTMIDELARHPNLVVIQTLSKSYSLAGLRVGLAFGSPEIIEAFYKVKDSYNVDAFAQAVAYAALTDVGYMKENAARIIQTRLAAVDELSRRGFRVYPSSANFVFAEHKKLSGREVYEGLKERRVLVRYFNQRRLMGGVRISMGTEEDMTRLYAALDEIVS